MEKEENVYGEISQAEEFATAKECVGDQKEDAKKASAALGKFKDVDALLKAYDCLQAEFTRRSQRLKELERAAENSANGNAATLGAEKLRKRAAERKAEEEKFDEFVSELESSEASPAQEAEPAKQDKVCLEKVCEETGGAAAIQENVSSVEARREHVELSSRELYEKASRDEEVRLKIIGEYLSSIGRAGVPLTFGGGGALTAPTRKAKTIDEAGNMALRWFQKEIKA